MQPQKLAGRTIEPITCVPSAAGTMPEATAAVTAGGGKVDVVGGGSSVSASWRIFFKEGLEKNVCSAARDHRAAGCDEGASAPGGASR